MSVTSLFNVTSNYIEDALAAKAEGPSDRTVSPGSGTKQRRAAPFSIRLSESERSRLVSEAAGVPLGSYIKAKVLGTPLPMRRNGVAVEDRKALASMLALLGRINVQSHLSELAGLASTGSLPLTPETEAELVAALRDLKALRALLMQALGLREGSEP